MPKQYIYNTEVHWTVCVAPISYQLSTTILTLSTLCILAVNHFFFIPTKCTYVCLVGIKRSDRALLFPSRLTRIVYAIFPHMLETMSVTVFSGVWPQLDSITQKQNYMDANRSKEHQNQQLVSLLHLNRKIFFIYSFFLLLVEASEMQSMMDRQCELHIHIILFYMSKCPHPVQFCNFYVICIIQFYMPICTLHIKLYAHNSTCIPDFLHVLHVHTYF